MPEEPEEYSREELPIFEDSARNHGSADLRLLELCRRIRIVRELLAVALADDGRDADALGHLVSADSCLADALWHVLSARGPESDS